jgi:hypothetical protein
MWKIRLLIIREEEKEKARTFFTSISQLLKKQREREKEKKM